MRCFKLYSNGDHRWFAFGQDQGRLDTVADTNQVVVTAGRSAMLMDPGGVTCRHRASDEPTSGSWWDRNR